MSNWKSYKFNDIVYFPPQVKLQKNNKYPFIAMEDVVSGTRFITNKQEKKYNLLY